MSNEKSSVRCAYWFPIKTEKGRDATIFNVDYGYDFKTDTIDLSVPCPVRDLAQKLGIQPKFLSEMTRNVYLKDFRRGLIEDQQVFANFVEKHINMERVSKFQ